MLFFRPKNSNKEKFSVRKFFINLLSILVIITTGYFILFSPTQTESAWYSSNWAFRKLLVIDDTKVSGSSNLTNFPVMVSLTDINLKNSAQSDGDDILFTSDNGTTKLDYELEKYSSATGQLVAWVEVPTLYGAAKTQIYMYYGNKAATSSDTQNATGVWPTSDYKGVWHLKEDPTSTCTGTKEVCDSTSNDNDADASGTMTSSDRVTGKAGDAIDFDGTDDALTFTDAANNEFATGEDVVFSAWVKANSGAGDNIKILGKNTTAGADVYQFLLAFGAPRASAKDSGFAGPNDVTDNSHSGLRDDKWHHIVFTWDHATNGTWSFFVDGAAGDTGTASTTNAIGTTTNPTVGSGTVEAYFFGSLDEVRMSTNLRSADWFTTEYNNQSSPSTFFSTVSTQQTQRDPVLYWNFDEGQGTTANDQTVHDNDGSFKAAGEPVLQSEDVCAFGKCLKFDGSNDYVRKTYAADLELDPGTASFTVASWFRHSSTPPTSSTTDVIISRSNGAVNGIGYKVYMNSSGQVCFGIDDDATSFPEDDACSSTSYADSKWHYVEAVKSGTTSLTLYIDGKQSDTQGSLSATGTLSGSSATFHVGIDSDGTSSSWDGFIDEVRYFDVARSATEILTDFNTKDSIRGASTTFGAGDAASSLSNGLVGYWKMDESSWTNNCSTTSVTDASGNANNAIACPNSTGPTGGAAGKFNKAGDFDGSNDYVAVSDTASLEPVADMTISAWVNLESLPSTRSETAAVVYKNHNSSPWNAYSLSIPTDNKPVFSWRNTSETAFQAAFTGTALVTSTWYHLVGVREGNRLKIYLNGTDANTTTATPTGTLFAADSELRIGASFSSSDRTDGQIDDIRIYNRALSDQEVRTLYEWAPGPAGYWKFDERTGTSANDTSTNGYTGTLTLGPTWTTGKFGSAVSFDNSDDYVTMGDVLNVTDTADVTISAWVYRSGSTLDTVVAKKTSLAAGTTGYILTVSNTDVVEFYASDGADQFQLTSSTTLSSGQWYHIVVVFDQDSAANSEIYINGKDDNATQTGTIANVGTLLNIQPLVIGAESDFQSPFGGRIDEVKIYNYTRSVKQIISDMNAGHPPVGTPVGSAAGHWSFDEGYGTTANDKSPNSNTLTLSTASWTTSGNFGKAWNGTGAIWVSRANDADLDFAATEDFTITGWFKSDSATNPANGTEYIVATTTGNTDKGYALYVNTDGTFCFGIDDDTTWGPDVSSCTSSDYYDGTWHHFIAVRDVTQDKTFLYIDALEKDSDTDSTTATLDGDNVFYIGDFDGDDNATSGTEEFAGDIDELKVYRAALNVDQIKVEYNQGKSQVLGALSTTSDGVTASFSNAREYCVPGDTSTCNPPTGEWLLNEKTGTTANDTSGNSNPLTLNTASWGQGKIGAGWNGLGTNWFCTGGCADDNDFDAAQADSISISLWFKSDSATNPSTNEHIIGKMNTSTQGYQIRVTTAGAIRFQVDDDTTFDPDVQTGSSVDYYDAQWHHVTVVKNGSSTISIYMDGKLEDSDDISTLVSLENSLAFVVGDRTGADGTDEFNGDIDQVRFYRYARTQAQAAWEYNRGGPIGWWKLDECTGTTLNDGSGNAKHLTATIASSGSNTSAGTCTGASSEAWKNGATGKMNYSLDFDGTDDFANLADDPLFDFGANQDFTASVWVKTTQGMVADQYPIIITKDGGSPRNGFNIVLHFSNTSAPWYGSFWSNDVSYQAITGATNTDVADGTWHHLVVQRSGSNLITYQDGRQTYNAVATSASMASSNAVRFARSNYGGAFDYWYDGQIDDVRIFNYALTATQIKTLYNENFTTRFAPASGSP